MRKQAAVRRLICGAAAALLCSAALLSSAGQAQTPASADAAERLLQERRFPEARAMLVELARREPNNARVAALAGNAHLALNEADAAVRQLERAVRLAPDSARYHFMLAGAYGLQTGQSNPLRQRTAAQRARESLERAVSIAPEFVPARVQLISFYMSAPGIAGGDQQQARTHINELMRHNRYMGTMMLNAWHIEQHDTASAIQALVAVSTAYPDSMVTRMALSQLYQEREQFDAAYAVIQPLVENERPQPGALYLTGRISAVTGQHLDRGERALRAYLLREPGSGDPPHAAAYARLGDILRLRGDPVGARREYEAALRLDPNLDIAKEGLRKLR